MSIANAHRVIVVQIYLNLIERIAEPQYWHFGLYQMEPFEGL